ncbi:hypothetical protein [Nocardia aurea]|uniref:hypothetical protein n=1 Tax=Nocardia aurea TaxID=2144174 RepID=UPI0033B151E1
MTGIAHGDVYRDESGTELTAVMPVQDWDRYGHFGPTSTEPVFGDIWIVRAADGRHLATYEGLIERGFRLASRAEVKADA